MSVVGGRIRSVKVSEWPYRVCRQPTPKSRSTIQTAASPIGLWCRLPACMQAGSLHHKPIGLAAVCIVLLLFGVGCRQTRYGHSDTFTERILPPTTDIRVENPATRNVAPDTSGVIKDQLGR